jgi:putative FmdB family regulatory protein
MPIYEYTCQKCGAHLEVMQKITDKPLARHPKCGGKLSKEWSQTSFQLKGSGWYVTDYAGKKQDSKDGAETKSEATEAKTTEVKKTSVEKSESKTESKSESKSESKAAKSSVKSKSGGKD